MEGYLLKTFSNEKIVLETQSQTIFLILIIFGIIFILILILLLTNLITSYRQTKFLFAGLALIAISGGLMGYLNPEPQKLELNAVESALIIPQRIIAGMKEKAIPFSEFELMRVYRGLDPAQHLLRDYKITYELAFEMISGNSLIIARSENREELENYAKKLTIVLDIDLYFDRTRFYKGFGRYEQDTDDSLAFSDDDIIDRTTLKNGTMYRWKEFRSPWLLMLMSFIYIGMIMVIFLSIIPSIPRNSLRRIKLITMILLAGFITVGFGSGFYYLIRMQNILMVTDDGWNYRQCIGRWKLKDTYYGENPITYVMNDLTDESHDSYIYSEDGYWNYIALILSLAEVPSLKSPANQTNLASMMNNRINISDFSLSLYEKFILSESIMND